MLTRHVAVFLGALFLAVPTHILVVYIMLSRGDMIGQDNLDILRASAYLAPSIILQVVPVIVGVATIVWLIYAEVNKHLLKMEILGSQVRKIILPLGVVFFAFMGFFIVFFQDPIANMFMKGNNMINNASQNSIKTSITEEGVWIRRFKDDKISIIHAEKFDKAMSTATNISFYLVTRDHQFLQRFSSKEAVLKEGYWLMRDGISISRDGTTDFFEERKLSTPLTLKEVISSLQSPLAISIWDMMELESILAKNGLPTSEHLSLFYYIISLPLFTAASIFCVFAVMFSAIRKHSLIIGIAYGTIAIVLVSFSVRMLHTLSQTGSLNPILGSALPSIIALAIGTVMVLRMKR